MVKVKGQGHNVGKRDFFTSKGRWAHNNVKLLHFQLPEVIGTNMNEERVGLIILTTITKYDFDKALEIPLKILHCSLCRKERRKRMHERVDSKVIANKSYVMSTTTTTPDCIPCVTTVPSNFHHFPLVLSTPGPVTILLQHTSLTLLQF